MRIFAREPGTTTMGHITVSDVDGKAIRSQEFA